MAVKKQIAQHTRAQQPYQNPVNEYGVPLRRNLPPGYQPYQQSPREQDDKPPSRYHAQRLPPIPAAHVPVTTDADLEEDERYYTRKPHSSAVVRHQPYPPPIRQPLPELEMLPEKRRHHWLFWLGMVFCIMLIGWTALSALSGFVQHKRDDLTFENPRIFQIDANVGHYGRVSHFVALNLHGYVEIFETQEGHPEVAKIYVPTAIRINPLDPVTLSFQDVTGNGKLDMIISSPSFQAVMFNNGTTFQPQPPAPGH